ncbi:hypothetical protein RSOLAG1IB_05873 [Rhizoctonia solani AG-1 IB]|uniref:Uncharacterized protein n=1 Tax=Thanatephorus cucumeris (strain AG1-IB / isolate 7/3/14) TaxID=1108050 RepID=A0A0B7F8Z5_THACB|nr:hypothetical protein RSOLAG1IB_05873 [Rhizoctonia solani AG-1 IB]
MILTSDGPRIFRVNPPSSARENDVFLSPLLSPFSIKWCSSALLGKLFEPLNPKLFGMVLSRTLRVGLVCLGGWFAPHSLIS